jgi:hypothetical protein
LGAPMMTDERAALEKENSKGGQISEQQREASAQRRNWGKIGSFAQWTSATLAIVSACISGFGLYLLWKVNVAAHQISQVNTRQAFFNRSVTVLDQYFYKIYEPSQLQAGRCLAYMMEIPDNIFVEYLNTDTNVAILFREEIANIAEIVEKLDATNDPKKDKTKEALYKHYDICLNLDRDTSFFSARNDANRLKSLIDNTKQNWLRAYHKLAVEYIPYIEIREHALMLWYDGTKSDREVIENPLVRSQYEEEGKLRIREIEFIEEAFHDNICSSRNRTAGLFKEVNRVAPKVYADLWRKSYPKFMSFLESCEKTKVNTALATNQ